MHRITLLLLDLLLVVLSTICAIALRDNLAISVARLGQLSPYLMFTLAAGAVVLPTLGLNKGVWRFSSMPDFVRVVLAVAVIVPMAVALDFVTRRMEGVPRSLPVLQGLVMMCLLVGVRTLTRLRHVHRSRGRGSRAASSCTQDLVLIVGINSVAELFLRSVEEFGDERVRVVGLLGHRDRHRGRLFMGLPVLGTAEELERVLADFEVHGQSVSRIVITARMERLSPAARGALLRVERTPGVQLDFFGERIVLNSHRSIAGGQGPTQDPDAATTGLARLSCEVAAANPYLRWKRALDVAGAAVALVCLAPLVALVCLLCLCAVGPPAIFWQQRPGAGGRPFKLYKFRTMASVHDRHGRRLSDGERTSVIGLAIRRLRLDELPQLYNILAGEMSFVGPRPLLPVDQSPAFAARLAVRPGLTGWAQIKGGRELGMSDKAALDIWYVRNASFWLDLKIMLATLRVVATGERTDQEAIDRAWRDLAAAGLSRPQNTEPARSVAAVRWSTRAQPAASRATRQAAAPMPTHPLPGA